MNKLTLGLYFGMMIVLFYPVFLFSAVLFIYMFPLVWIFAVLAFLLLNFIGFKILKHKDTFIYKLVGTAIGAIGTDIILAGILAFIFLSTGYFFNLS
jgi:hypothetical protein